MPVLLRVATQPSIEQVNEKMVDDLMKDIEVNISGEARLPQVFLVVYTTK